MKKSVLAFRTYTNRWQAVACVCSPHLNNKKDKNIYVLGSQRQDKLKYIPKIDQIRAIASKSKLEKDKRQVANVWRIGNR